MDSPLHLRGLERWQKTWRMPPAAFSHFGTDLYLPSIHSYASLHVQRSLSVSTPVIKPSRFSSYHERPWVDQVHAWPDSFRLKHKAKLTTKTIYITGTKSTACCYNMNQEDPKQQSDEHADCRVQRNTLISERDSLLAASREDKLIRELDSANRLAANREEALRKQLSGKHLTIDLLSATQPLARQRSTGQPLAK